MLDLLLEKERRREDSFPKLEEMASQPPPSKLLALRGDLTSKENKPQASLAFVWMSGESGPTLRPQMIRLPPNLTAVHSQI